MPAFDAVLHGLIDAGLVSRRSRQRLDSTHVLGLVGKISSLEMVRETMRVAVASGGEWGHQVLFQPFVVSSHPMKRLLRWTFNFSAVMSALLFVATCVFWERAHRGEDRLIFYRGEWGFSIISDRADMPDMWRGLPNLAVIRCAAVHYTLYSTRPSKVEFQTSVRSGIPFREPAFNMAELQNISFFIDMFDDPLYAHDPPRPARWYYGVRADSGEGIFNGLHNVGPDGRVPSDFRYHRAAICDWTLSLVSALAPALWLGRRLRARRRSRAGLCVCCGYDLRATRDRCPECGTVPTPATKPV